MYNLLGSSIDFISDQFNITIRAGETTGNHHLLIICDKVVEDDESFNLTLSLAIDNSRIIISQSTAIAQITDSTGNITNHFLFTYYSW